MKTGEMFSEVVIIYGNKLTSVGLTFVCEELLVKPDR